MPEKKPKTDHHATAKPTDKASSPPLPLTAGMVAAQAWMDMGTETIRFFWNRLQQSQKTRKELLACASLEEMRQVQTAFLSHARDQYTAEASKMIDLISKAATAGKGAASTARRYDDVPL